MIHTFRRALLISVLATTPLLNAGCRGDKAPPQTPNAEPEGHRPATTVGEFDPTTMKEALQGRWDVQQGTRDLFFFEFDGDKARVVDVRFAAPRFIDGALTVRSATGFGITDQDGVTSFYSAVLVEDAAFIGLGDAVELSEGDTFEAKLSAWERLTLNDDGSCTYTKRWGEQVNTQEVTCEFTKKGGREIFTYEADDQFRPDRLKRYEWIRVGNYLLSRELADAEAHRLAPDETSAVDPGTSPGPGEAYGALGKPVPGGPQDQAISENADAPDAVAPRPATKDDVQPTPAKDQDNVPEKADTPGADAP